MNGEDLWVVVPVAQRRDGAWLDDTLTARNAEAGLTARAPDGGRFPRQRVELFRAPGAAAAVDEAYRRRGWTDGLPIVAPTTGRVAELVTRVRRPPRDVVAELAPLGGLATVERVAANAVMAGCGPAQFPYVVAAVEAVADPAFNLAGVQTTDENVAPLVVVSAPAAAREVAEIHAGTGLLGPGWRGNATIGRALRLVLHNLGGGWPGAVSLAGAGQPGRYTLCAAEDDEVCPWPPLRVELGHDVEEAIVVVTRAESAVNVTGGVAEIVSVMSSATSLFTAVHRGIPALLLAPHTAAELATAGAGRADVAARLAGEAHLPADLWNAAWVAERVAGRPDRSEDVTVVADPESFVIFVAGGRIPIPQHVWFPSWGFPPCCVSRRVQLH
ncbi:MAG: hypothetical protein ACFCVK_24590 [Acidimicrobiales bacterium]